MKICIVFGAFLLSVFATPMINEQFNHEWNLFKQNYEKQYASLEEEIIRRMIWQDNIEKIEKHNNEAKQGLHSFTLGMNQFGDLTHEEFQNQMNIKTLPKRTSQSNFERFTVPIDVIVPRAVDWRAEGAVAPVRDQGHCGSSYAIAATGALEGQFFTQYRELTELSIQNILDCSTSFGNAGCDGGIIEYSYNYIKAAGGINTEKDYPYEAKTGTCRFNRTTVAANCTRYVDIEPGDENALTYAIAIRGPIAVAFDASHSSFQFYKAGVYDEPQCSQTNPSHAGLAVGFNATESQLYYIVRNSYTTDWGIDGYIWMSRQNDNQCGIASNASWPRVY